MVNCFIPLYAINRPLENARNGWIWKSEKQIVMVDEFGGCDRHTMELFVEIIRNRKVNIIQNISWEELVKLMKLAHFFQYDIILMALYKFGKIRVNQQNILQSCNMRQIMESENWKNLMKLHPQRVAIITCEILKLQETQR